jgi:dynein heavy chain
MNSTILIRDPETQELFVNFDPQVNELMKEAVYFERMHLEIPQAAKSVLLLSDKIDSYISRANQLVDKYKDLLVKVPKDLLPLIKPSQEKVEHVLKPGLISITWLSTNIEDYIKSCNDELDSFENLNVQIKDILENRVENVLQEISVSSLLEAPAEPVTIDEFSKLAEESSQKSLTSLSRYIKLCESAVEEILDTLRNHLSESEKKTIKLDGESYYDCVLKHDPKNRGQRCQECIPCSYFNFLTLYTQKNNDALINCTRFTFDTLKKRLQQSNKYIGQSFCFLN